MARTSDRDRILGMLSDTGSGISNQRLRTVLNLSIERYDSVRNELLDEGLIEKYRARGGAIRLTRKGERHVVPDEKTSQVEKESDLYPCLVEALSKEYEDEFAHAFDTGRLRKRGQWKNPDVTLITVEVYPWLGRREIRVRSYEVKRYGDNNVTCVFEAASHASFAHEAYVVFEEVGKFDDSDPRIEQILAECQKFGIGFCTLEKHYSSYRLKKHLEAMPKQAPQNRDVNEWLDYAFNHHNEAHDKFLELWKQSKAYLNEYGI